MGECREPPYVDGARWRKQKFSEEERDEGRRGGEGECVV
jgi:hypothetical protein